MADTHMHHTLPQSCSLRRPHSVLLGRRGYEQPAIRESTCRSNTIGSLRSLMSSWRYMKLLHTILLLYIFRASSLSSAIYSMTFRDICTKTNVLRQSVRA